MNFSIYSVFLIYGLIFFLLGLTCIIISFFNKTKHKFFDKLLYFGIAVILKGLTEWEHLFFPLFFYELNLNSFVANLGYRLLIAISAFFQLVFALELLISYNYKLKYLRFLYLIIPTVFFIYFFIFPGNLFIKDIIKWSLAIENVSRRLILLPAGVIASITIFLYAKRFPSKSLRIALNGFGMLLAINYLLVGIFIFSFEHDLNPMLSKFEKIYSEQTFYKLFGIPLEYVEIFLALGMLFAILYAWFICSREETSENLAVRDELLLDNERERLSRDLHDGVIQSLYGISLRVSHITDLFDQRQYDIVKESLKQLKSSLADSINEIRYFIYNDLAEEYRYENIEEGINNLLKEFQELTSISIDFMYTNTYKPDLWKNVVVNIYLIIKEAVTNIIKHSRATKAVVTVKIDADKIFISIKDNGVGFKNASLSGMGIVSLTKRVAQLNGTFFINQNNGVELEINIPLEGNNQ